ncbi:ABC transporter substrate-binding protein [Dongshaea marina]|uniref:ABC transporter substrate-binding protein n=1 Tax=Dongshaea marina TaxID=2047966 RepID=UPI001901F052|nr:ABC transporter substrate-binding protein [Dongshaea marina]
MSLKPDVVFMSNYAPEQMVSQVERLGIPVIRMSFFVAGGEQQTRLNPKIKDPALAYRLGMEQGIRLLGQVFHRQQAAEALVHEIKVTHRLIAKRVSGLTASQRTSLYMANPDMNTYGSGKFTGVMMSQAGGNNVAHEIHGYGKVTMEQILAWDPRVIFVQSRYSQVAKQIMSDPAWQGVSALKNHRLHISPEYVKPWGHPVPESYILGELWMAKKLHPKLFADIDLNQRVESFYQTFYHSHYLPREQQG